jgi:SAM-dependent methyltransferase
MRSAVWARCAARFAPGSRVLEMNCGTGEDAVWLAQRGVHVLATDLSPAMLAVAASKFVAVPGAVTVQFQQLAWEDLGSLNQGPFDGALSNFGGLNCVRDLHSAASALGKTLRPGATAILCIMGPLVPWEWIWFLGQGHAARAFRRMRPNGARWSGVTIRYPSIGTTRRAFAPAFRLLRVAAIGAVLPPPYTEPRLGRHRQLLAALNHFERRFETWWPLPWLADHYLMELERL